MAAAGITLEEHNSFATQEWGFSQAVFEGEMQRMRGKVRSRLAL